MEKQMNVPRLRFPGFECEWNTVDLGKVSNWSSGGTPSKDNLNFWNGDIPWITASSMRGCEYSRSDLKITKEGLKEGSKLAPKGSLLMLVRGSMLFKKIPIGMAMRDLAFNQDVKSIEIQKGNDARFVLYWFYASEHLLLNKVTGTGIGAGKLDLEDLKKLSLIIPESSEQKKIANFLAGVDNKLSLLKKKKILLEKYKKGVMRKIFSQELRFKDNDGNDFADWEEKKLGEVGESYNGLTGKTKEDFGTGKPYIQYKQIFDDSKIDITRFDFVDIREKENQNIVIFGDAFFTVSSETPEEVGMASVLLEEVGELYLNSFCFGYRATSLDLINPYFSRYLFRSEFFRKDVVVLAQGSTRFNISKTQFMKLVIKLPSFPEQTKIANFLSAIDDKINQCGIQIEKMELWKKGLLQQMFV